FFYSSPYTRPEDCRPPPQRPRPPGQRYPSPIFSYSAPIYCYSAVIKAFVQILFNGNGNPVFGKDLFDQFSPFDQADSVSVKIIVAANLFHLLHIPDPVHVKVIERKASFLINLENRKS